MWKFNNVKTLPLILASGQDSVSFMTPKWQSLMTLSHRIFPKQLVLNFLCKKLFVINELKGSSSSPPPPQKPDAEPVLSQLNKIHFLIIYLHCNANLSFMPQCSMCSFYTSIIHALSICLPSLRTITLFFMDQSY